MLDTFLGGGIQKSRELLDKKLLVRLNLEMLSLHIQVSNLIIQILNLGLQKKVVVL